MTGLIANHSVPGAVFLFYASQLRGVTVRGDDEAVLDRAPEN